MSDHELDESVDMNIVTEPMPEAMIEEADEAEPAELSPLPVESDMSVVDDRNLDLVLEDEEGNFVRELIYEILLSPETQIMIRMNRMHPTTVICNKWDTGEFVRFILSGPSKSQLPVYQFAQFSKALQDIVKEGIQETTEEEPEEESKN